ncbi:MAG: hypothetical protein CM1200mP41_10880 [Gammaproteobacteria bacterium]|nr:MAG: hypothetical protein CM1200mP41_10880 [Gammaproteobacteria bacterium]
MAVCYAKGPLRSFGFNRLRVMRVVHWVVRSRRGTSIWINPVPATLKMHAGAYLGPAFTMPRPGSHWKVWGALYNTLEGSELYSSVAELLAKAMWLDGFRDAWIWSQALGARLSSGAEKIEMQSVMNLKIKYRESFRPFAPAVLAERIADYFEQAEDSPYMLLVANVREMLRKKVSVEDDQLFGIDKLNVFALRLTCHHAHRLFRTYSERPQGD